MLLDILFPPKCVLCHKLLAENETDLCHNCRANAPTVGKPKRNIQNIAQWTAVWYYKDDVRFSIHRYKFNNQRSYADAYARLLAVKLIDSGFLEEIDTITWAPVSFLRRFKRGYDQAQLIAAALSEELNLPVMKLLRKHRNTTAQSSLKDAASRRANIQGAYKATDPANTTGKTILLIDDVLTTGSTATECALMLHTAGAKNVYLATIAVTDHENSNKRR